jgi:hypothetical protein
MALVTFSMQHGPSYTMSDRLLYDWARIYQLNRSFEDAYFELFATFPLSVQATLMLETRGCTTFLCRWMSVFRQFPDKDQYALTIEAFAKQQCREWLTNPGWMHKYVSDSKCIDAYTAMYFEHMSKDMRRGFLSNFPSDLVRPVETLKPVFDALLSSNDEYTFSLFVMHILPHGVLGLMPMTLLTTILDKMSIHGYLMNQLLSSPAITSRLSTPHTYAYIRTMDIRSENTYHAAIDNVLVSAPGVTEMGMLTFIALGDTPHIGPLALRTILHYKHPEVTIQALLTLLFTRPERLAVATGNVKLMSLITPKSSDVYRIYNGLVGSTHKIAFILKFHTDLDTSDAVRILPEMIRLAGEDTDGKLRLMLSRKYDRATLVDVEKDTVCDAYSTASCSDCTTVTSKLVLLQDRCRAICQRKDRCKRRHIPNGMFCQQHENADRTARSLSRRVGRERGIQMTDVKETGYRPRDLSASMTQYPVSDPFTEEKYSSTGLQINLMDFATSDGPCPIDTEAYMLPVSRVDNLFLGEEGSGPDEYIGKYYVYEPNSVTYLRLGNFRVFGTKVHAYSALLAEYRTLFPDRFQLQSIKTVTDQTVSRVVHEEARKNRYTIDDPDSIHRTYITDYVALHTNLFGGYHPEAVANVLNAKPICSFFPKKLCGWRDNGTDLLQHLRNIEVFFLSVFKREADTGPELLYDIHWQNRLYRSTYDIQSDTEDVLPTAPCDETIGVAQTLHPLFPSINPNSVPIVSQIDQFQYYDMPIGSLARALGIDTLILQHEFITNQSQTEIFHVKQHADKFTDICRIETCISNTDRGTRRVPSIWLPLDDGLYRQQPSGISYRVVPDEVNIQNGVVSMGRDRTRKTTPQLMINAIDPARALFVRNGGMSILTLNVQFYKVISGLYSFFDDAQRGTYKAVGDTIIQHLPDIVCLQEDIFPRQHTLGIEHLYTEVVHCLAESVQFDHGTAHLANTIFVRKSKDLVVSNLDKRT